VLTAEDRYGAKFLKVTSKLRRIGRMERPRSNFPVAHDGVKQLGVSESGQQRVGVGHVAHAVQIKMPVRINVVPEHQFKEVLRSSHPVTGTGAFKSVKLAMKNLCNRPFGHVGREAAAKAAS